jgi:tetratricopeptide (TPR) repeat protein
VELKLKVISKSGIPEALSKVTLYRSLNEPEEAESICHDILAIDPDNQVAQRMLGLAVTDQFTGQGSDRYAEVESVFERLSDPYERDYYLGILYERRAKAQMRAGRPPNVLVGLFQHAMHYFEEAEKIHPPDNDDAVLRWNRCVRLLHKLPEVELEPEIVFEDHDIAPVEVLRRTGRRAS